MEEFDLDNEREEEEEEDESLSDIDDGSLTFDDIVSFTMLTETTVTLIGIIVFFLLTVFKIF
ncbi:MAG: hypothetical protein GY863_14230 [bacterium]|nr:hypothetical protein [bacterium]